MNDKMSHEEWHEAAHRAQQEHAQRVREDNLRSDAVTFSCLLAPGDEVGIVRNGPPGGKSTHITLGMTNHGESMVVALSPATARRFVAAMLDVIEECQPDAPLLKFHPDTFKGDN